MNIKEFLKPTKAKILTIVLIYIGSVIADLLSGGLILALFPDVFEFTQNLKNVLSVEESVLLLPDLLAISILSFVINLVFLYLAVCTGFYFYKNKLKSD